MDVFPFLFSLNVQHHLNSLKIKVVEARGVEPLSEWP